MSRTLLGPGAHGGVVGEVQRALLSAGFDPATTDGIYGPDTTAAVESFQQAHGLRGSGVVDDVTWQELMQKPILGADVRSLERSCAEWWNQKGSTGSHLASPF